MESSSYATGPDEASAVLVGLLKVLPFPCLLTDTAGRSIDRNAAFGELMEPLGIRLVTGRLRFTQPVLQGHWQAALARCEETTLQAVAASGRRWKLKLVPLHAALCRCTGLDKLLLLVAEEQFAVAPIAPQAIATTGKLTKAEAEVFAGLLQGQTAKAIAKERGASVHTVRTQITAILEKTGRGTQKELIASFGASSFGASFTNSSFGDSSFAEQAEDA